MAKRGKGKGKGKPQESAPMQAATPASDAIAVQFDVGVAPAEAIEPVLEPDVVEPVAAGLLQIAVEVGPSKPAKPAKASKPLHKPRLKPRDTRSPFLVLADYEQRSLAHIAGLPEQLDAPGLWRGVAYRVGSHRLASGFGEVVEIMSMPALTPVPGSQPWLLGVANVRGTLLPVVDLKQFLEGERTVLHESQRVLVVRQSGGDVAVTIDEMYGQRSFVDAQGIDAEPVSEGRYAYFIDRAYRINDQDWGVFSLERLARTPEFRQAAA